MRIDGQICLYSLRSGKHYMTVNRAREECSLDMLARKLLEEMVEDEPTLTLEQILVLKSFLDRTSSAISPKLLSDLKTQLKLCAEKHGSRRLLELFNLCSPTSNT